PAWNDKHLFLCVSSSSIPPRPASETGRKHVMLIFFNPSGFSPSESDAAATAGAEMIQICLELDAGALPRNSSNFGNQGRPVESLLRTPPVKSKTIASLASAAMELRSANSRDPAKNTNLAPSKLPSSTG